MTGLHPDTATPPAPTVAPPPWPPADASVVLKGVSKSFSGLVAVSDIFLALQPGVTALLGPNGAGKSTLLRLICGLARPSTGTVWVAGGNPRFDADVRARIGLVPQQDGVFESLTALETVELAARLSRLAEPRVEARRALALVELDPTMTRPVGTFSKGMRQRVKVAQALVHDPALLILDEPLNGLDPRQRHHLIELFAELGHSGRTVLVSSHVLEEVERFGSRVVVVAKGRLVAEGDYRQIRNLLNQQPHRIRVECDRPRAMAIGLMALEPVISCTVTDTGDRRLPPDRAPAGPLAAQADSTMSAPAVEVTTNDVAELRRALPVVAKRLDLTLSGVVPLDDDLESVFRYLVGGPPGGAQR